MQIMLLLFLCVFCSIPAFVRLLLDGDIYYLLPDLLDGFIIALFLFAFTLLLRRIPTIE